MLAKQAAAGLRQQTREVRSLSVALNFQSLLRVGEGDQRSWWKEFIKQIRIISTRERTLQPRLPCVNGSSPQADTCSLRSLRCRFLLRVPQHASFDTPCSSGKGVRNERSKYGSVCTYYESIGINCAIVFLLIMSVYLSV